MTVKELMSRVSSSEFTEWLAYSKVEPFGEERGDLRAGIIASTIANVNRKKGASPFKPSDFMPTFFKPRQTVDDQIATFRRLTTDIQDVKTNG